MKKHTGHRLQVTVTKTLTIVAVLLLQLFTITCNLSPVFAVEQGIQIPSANELSQLSATQFKYQWIKFQYVWGSEQPIDEWTSSAKQAGYKVLVSVAKKPATIPTGEEGYQYFGNFMQELAYRLGSNVDAYEIWNEPNLNDEWAAWGTIDPKEYVKLLQYGATGVRNGNPNAKIITAALAPLSGHYDDEKFFNEFVAAGGLDIAEVDAIGWHSNVTSDIPPQNDSPEGFQRVKIALNQPKPVWITEFGWNRSSAQIDRQAQLQYITDAFVVANELGGIETMIIWNFGFGKLNSEFAPWDISLEATGSRQQAVDNANSGCEGLNAQECALKLQNIATLPENISKNVSSGTTQEQNSFQKIFQSVLGFFGFSVNKPDTFSSRSNVQVKTDIPETAQAKNDNSGIQTSENLGVNPANLPKSDNVQGIDTQQQGVGIYQVDLPKEVQNALGASLDFTCAYENSQYPTGIRPINGSSSQTKCDEALKIK